MPTSKELDAANRFAAFQKGWAAGAVGREMDARLVDSINDGIKRAYEQGYTEGMLARDKALRGASNRYGHKPSVLRSAGMALEETNQSG